MTAEQDKIQQRMRPLILAAMDTKGGYECARNALRYEAMKAAPTVTLTRLHFRAAGGEDFDGMIDELILKD